MNEFGTDDLEGKFWAIIRRYDERCEDGKRLMITVSKEKIICRAGGFRPTKSNLGFIKIYRRDPPDWFKSICTLFHELGHAQSWFDGDRLDEYQAIIETNGRLTNLSNAEKRLVIDEEKRAWQHGYELAKKNGLTDDAAFVAEANRALIFYFEGFNMPPEPLEP